MKTKVTLYFGEGQGTWFTRDYIIEHDKGVDAEYLAMEDAMEDADKENKKYAFIGVYCCSRIAP